MNSDAQILVAPLTMTTSSSLPWWKHEPLSILELADPLHVAAHGRDAFEPRRVVERMRQLNATAAHVFPLGCHLDGNVLFFRHHSPTDPPMRFDYLAEWLEHSTPAKLRTIVYFNVHSVKGAHARKHPQWQQRRFDGSPKEDVYNIESTFCVNSPWRQWVFDRLRELCAYPIDGIFFDGPVFFPECCYCDHCRAQFEARYGGAMPASEALADPLYAEWVEFRADSIAAFMRDSRDVIKSIRQDILFYCNANPLQPARLTARDNRKLADVQDILASEGGFLGGDLMTDSPIWKVGMNAKLLETQARGLSRSQPIPHLVFDSIIHTPWTYSTLPAAEARLLWSSSVAHGAGTWMSAYKDAMDRPAVSAVGPMYDLARRHRDALFNTRSAANVAIVVSATTLNYYAGADVPHTDFTAARCDDRPGNVTRELYGWYHALWTSHVPFDVIDEVTIEREDLSRYRAVVLPNTACVSDQFVNRMRAFVERGGVLLASLQSGFFDECGRQRSVPALDEVLGVRRNADAAVRGPRRWDYLFDRASGACIPSPAYAIEATSAGDTQILHTFSRPLADRYADLPQDSGAPAVTRHPFGQGSTFYFACDIGAAMWQWRIPEHLAMVRDAVARLIDPPLRLRGAPPCVDMSLRRDARGDSLFVHLVNYNGGMTRPIERVLPIHDLIVEVKCRPRAGMSLLSSESLEATSDGQWTQFKLPVLTEYEVIKLEI